MLRRLSNLFNRSPSDDRKDLEVAVRCDRCREVIRTRINLEHDLSVDYGESQDQDTYICRKVLMGSQRCFNRVEITLKFDARRKLTDRQVVGGEFVPDDLISDAGGSPII